MPLKVTRDPNDLRPSLNREFSVGRLQRRTSTRFERRASIQNSNKRVHNMKVDDGMNSTNSRFANLIDDSGDKMMRRSFLHHSKSFRGNTLNASEMKEDSDDDDDDDEFEQKVFKPRRESLVHAKSRQSLMSPTGISKDIAAMILELVAEEDEKEDAHDMDSSSLDNSSSDNDDTKYDKSRSTTTTTSRRKSNISFTKVIIKEYPYTLGDNPGGGQGVPLTIEWEPMTTEVIDFDEYELLREQDRRVLHQLKIPKKDRVDILINAGYTQKQITKAINYVQNLRIQRLQTKQTLYNMVKDERNEKVKKKVKNFFTGYKKKERKYLEHSLSFTFMYIENEDASNGGFTHRKTALSSSCQF